MRIPNPARANQPGVHAAQQEEKRGGQQRDTARETEDEQGLQGRTDEDPGGETEVVEDDEEEAG